MHFSQPLELQLWVSRLALRVRTARVARLIRAVCRAAVAAAIMYTAPSLEFLLLGRITYGLGIGFGMHAAPAYIAEVCPPQVRLRSLGFRF